MFSSGVPVVLKYTYSSSRCYKLTLYVFRLYSLLPMTRNQHQSHPVFGVIICVAQKTHITLIDGINSIFIKKTAVHHFL